MKDSQLERLQSLAAQLSQTQNVVAQALYGLEEELKQRLSDVKVWGQSCNVDLEMIDEDEWRYGHIIFDGEGLEIAHRTTFDDFEDGFNQVPTERQTYKSEPLASISSTWHIKLSEEKVIDSLLQDIEKNIEEKLKETQEAASSLDKILSTESSTIDMEAQEVLNDYSGLLSQWVKARRAVETDPADSITRSSSYLESVCRLVIEESNQGLPRDCNEICVTAYH